MINLNGPGSGISPHSASWSMLGAMRSAQAELRAVQRANGNTALGDDARLALRPVPEAQAPDIARRPEMRRGEGAGLVDPLLTGPRPTFSKTPLEKMRTDAFMAYEVLQSPEVNEEAPKEQAAKPPEPTSPNPRVPYGDLDGIAAPKTAIVTLDRTT